MYLLGFLGICFAIVSITIEGIRHKDSNSSFSRNFKFHTYYRSGAHKEKKHLTNIGTGTGVMIFKYFPTTIYIWSTFIYAPSL